MQVGVEAVLGAEAGVGDVAEDVLGEQRRRQREGGDEQRDRGEEQAPRQRRRPDEHAHIGEEGGGEEGEVAARAEPDSVPVGAEQPAGGATRRGRDESSARCRQGHGAEEQAGEAGEADAATPGWAQVSPPLPPAAGGGAAGGGAGATGGEGAGAGAGTGCWVPAPGAYAFGS